MECGVKGEKWAAEARPPSPDYLEQSRTDAPLIEGPAPRAPGVGLRYNKFRGRIRPAERYTRMAAALVRPGKNYLNDRQMA
jgi:hypothetical protein